MSQAQYCTVSDVKADLGVPQDTDDVLISRYVDRACHALERKTRLTWAATTWTNAVFRPPDVTWLRPGVLRVRVGVPHITAITALAYKTGSPLNAWVALTDLSVVDIQTADYVWWVDVYLNTCSTDGPVWVQLSGTAGYAPTAYPPDLVQLATGWAAYLYRSKDVPNEKTANPMLGTVTVPSAFPVKLTPLLETWFVCEVA